MTTASSLAALTNPSTASSWRDYSRGAIPVLTWAGLKGGISIALALSLPTFPDKGLLVACTYVVVLFSIVVQGLTVGRVIRWVQKSETAS